MDKSLPVQKTASNVSTAETKEYVRFDLSQRIEHAVLLVSFSILGITGLAQKFANTVGGESVIGWFGGIEQTRIIHRSAAIVLMAVSVYHVLALAYRMFVLRVDLSMLPVFEDFRHLYQDILYYIGKRKHMAFYGRYSYAEKVEYLAVVWGTVIMAITGFMMWNPVATTRWLSGEFIPAAKAAHGGEALLAVLAIILWHFYHVHLRDFNQSMFTGKLTEEQMKHEHPAELAHIKSGGDKPLQEAVIRRRQQYFFPAAAILTVVFSFGLYKFATFENTAISYVPTGETAPVYVPFTPTPSPVPSPTPSPVPGGVVLANTWQGGFEQLFNERCGTCHVQGAMGGLSLATYDSTLQGGNEGPAVVPGDPEASVLVQVQSTGNHPGQLTEEELAAVIAWIKAGAPEQ